VQLPDVEHFGLALALTGPGLACVGDAEGRLLQVSDQVCTLTGYSRDELVGRSFLALASGATDRSVYVQIWEDLTAGKVWEGELSNLTKGGEFYWVRATLTPIMDKEGRLARFVVSQTDVTPYKRSVLHYEQEVIKLSAVAEGLSAARDAAVQADKLKLEFLAGMSDSFRTPLHAILDFAQVLSSAKRSGEEAAQAETVQSIVASGRGLLSTLDELLDWLSVAGGAATLNIEPTSLTSVIDDVLVDTRSLAEKRGVSLLLPPPGLEFVAECDSRRLQQVLRMIMEQSLENSREDGWLSIDVQHETNELKLIVADSGRDLPAGTIGCSHKASPCWLRRESVCCPLPELRLSLALGLMRSMGGDLVVSSQPELGTRFTLTLPLSRVVITEQAPSGKVTLGRPLLILSVEDNVSNARLLNAYISRIESATLLEAGTAIQGLKLALGLKPDVILMDIHLPGMDGYEALARIKSDSRLSSCKVVALTIESHPEQVRRGLKAGFDDYLIKPLIFENLVTSLAKLTNEALPRLPST
jgi:PAS domain S-box-containing protein